MDMLFEEILIVLAILLFIGAVAIELRRDRDKKMYVGREAKTNVNESSSLPVVQPEAQLPVATQEEIQEETKEDLNTPKKTA